MANGGNGNGDRAKPFGFGGLTREIERGARTIEELAEAGVKATQPIVDFEKRTGIDIIGGANRNRGRGLPPISQEQARFLEAEDAGFVSSRDTGGQPAGQSGTVESEQSALARSLGVTDQTLLIGGVLLGGVLLFALATNRR